MREKVYPNCACRVTTVSSNFLLLFRNADTCCWGGIRPLFGMRTLPSPLPRPFVIDRRVDSCCMIESLNAIVSPAIDIIKRRIRFIISLRGKIITITKRTRPSRIVYILAEF